MVLAEALGAAEFRDRVKIYATDVDDEALAYARHGAYTDSEVRASRRPARPLLRHGRRQARLPQGSAPLGHLRPQRPRPGRAHLPDRPLELPQHADVLHS
jgi:hypothetical protein